jgi:hypothetical protein
MKNKTLWIAIGVVIVLGIMGGLFLRSRGRAILRDEYEKRNHFIIYDYEEIQGFDEEQITSFEAETETIQTNLVSFSNMVYYPELKLLSFGFFYEDSDEYYNTEICINNQGCTYTNTTGEIRYLGVKYLPLFYTVSEDLQPGDKIRLKVYDRTQLLLEEVHTFK